MRVSNSFTLIVSSLLSLTALSLWDFHPFSLNFLPQILTPPHLLTSLFLALILSHSNPRLFSLPLSGPLSPSLTPLPAKSTWWGMAGRWVSPPLPPLTDPPPPTPPPFSPNTLETLSPSPPWWRCVGASRHRILLWRHHGEKSSPCPPSSSWRASMAVRRRLISWKQRWLRSCCE